MVVVRTWQSKYWLRLGGLKIGQEKWNFFLKSGSSVLVCGGGLTGGRGWVAVVPLERGDRGGSNGGGLTVAVAVLAEIKAFEKMPRFQNGNFNLKKSGCPNHLLWQWLNEWQWLFGSGTVGKIRPARSF
jgi:hypothetical protein